MEACAGAHHWGRILRDAGYQVKIIPPQFVKPFVKSNKNDANDAQAICEAMARPNMYPVSIKTVEQQDIQAMHRIREEIKTHRTAKANQIRGLVAEYGLVAPKQLSSLRAAITLWLEDASNGLTMLFRQLLQGLWMDLRSLDRRMTELDKQIAVIAQQNPTAKRLQALRGVGPLIATALIATVGDGKQYRQRQRYGCSHWFNAQGSIALEVKTGCLESVNEEMLTSVAYLFMVHVLHCVRQKIKMTVSVAGS